MDELLAGLRAAGEPTRLRLLSLCAHAELSVSELTRILGQSQPRVSRHLKLLVEAGLLSRFREGSLVFYRLATQEQAGHLAKTLVDLLPEDDTEISRDLTRLDTVRKKRATIAENYFRENAANWNKIRALHVAEADVEALLLKIAGNQRIGQFLDIGTGTGRMLELFAEQFERGVGIDTSADMLSIARTQLEDDRYKHIQIRKGDMYNMPIDDQSVDMAVLHLVLHFSLEPASVIAEAARTLKPSARLLIIDFAAHQEEHLRSEHQHQRLGFTDKEIKKCIQHAGLEPGEIHALEGDPLTVKVWLGQRK